MSEETHHPYQQQQQLPEQAKWSDMLKLHEQVQRSKDDFEKHFGKQRQYRYKEELDQLIQNRIQQKEEQKKQDELIRDKYKGDLEDFKEKEKLNQLKLRQSAQEIAEQSLKERQNKVQYTKMLREQEKQFLQHQFQEYAEADKSKKIHQQELKVAASLDQQQQFENDQKLKMMDNQRAKEIDKHYSESYGHLLENQETNRKQFLDRLNQNIRNKDDFLNYYQKIFEEDARKKHEIDRNIIEKGLIEQMRREQDLQRQNYIHKQQMRHSTLDVLQQQMQYRKDNEKLQRELEIQTYNQQLLRNKQEFDYAEQLKRQKQEIDRQQTRNILDKQVEEHQMNKVAENILTSVEHQLNRNDINVLKHGLSPSTQIAAPSFVPGRNLTFERQTQLHYMNKALHVDESEPVPLHHQPRKSEIQANIHEPPPQQSQRSNHPEKTKHIRSDQHEANQMKSSPLIGHPSYNQPPRIQSKTPLSIGSRQQYQAIQQESIQHQSIQNYQMPNPRKDYLYVRNKNGPHSNPLNIISNEFKTKPTTFY